MAIWMTLEEPIPPTHYFTQGLSIFVICGIILTLFMGYFTESIQNTQQYEKTQCRMVSVTIKIFRISCIDNDYSINLVDMPCVVAFVDTHKFKNLLLYRNYGEKIWTEKKASNVSNKA